MVTLPVHRRPDNRGQGLVEYALILMLIAMLCIAALVMLGGQLSGYLVTIGNSV